MIHGCSAAALWVAIVVTMQPEPTPTDPEHTELMKVRTKLIAAWNKKDMDGVLALCHPKIVATWQNGEVTEGREGIKGYYEKMMVGPKRIVEEMTANPTVDHLAVIYGGDTAVSRGKMNDHYKLADGTEFDMNSRWSATLVKEGDDRLSANYHASAPAFDNPLLNMMLKKAAMWSGVTGGVIGVIVGAIVAAMMARRKTSAAR